MQAVYSNFSNRPYYIKTTDEKQEACIYYNNKELCLSKGYWVAGDTDGQKTEKKLKSAMEEALGESASCFSASEFTYCSVGDFYCAADSFGGVGCNVGVGSCNVDGAGNANCS